MHPRLPVSRLASGNRRPPAAAPSAHRHSPSFAFHRSGLRLSASARSESPSHGAKTRFGLALRAACRLTRRPHGSREEHWPAPELVLSCRAASHLDASVRGTGAQSAGRIPRSGRSPRGIQPPPDRSRSGPASAACIGLATDLREPSSPLRSPRHRREMGLAHQHTERQGALARSRPRAARCPRRARGSRPSADSFVLIAGAASLYQHACTRDAASSSARSASRNRDSQFASRSRRTSRVGFCSSPSRSTTDVWLEAPRACILCRCHCSSRRRPSIPIAGHLSRSRPRCCFPTLPAQPRHCPARRRSEGGKWREPPGRLARRTPSSRER